MTNPIAQTLEQHFDVAFTAPNGIKKLRELILILAMQGKLVPQDPNDAPASELLKDIANEKVRLVSEGKIKKQKPLPAISDDEKPYDLPQGWEWSVNPFSYKESGFYLKALPSHVDAVQTAQAASNCSYCVVGHD